MSNEGDMASRLEAEQKRQQEAERRRVERFLAAAGGAGFGITISLFGEIFRMIGGPTIIANVLRTPGTLQGTVVPVRLECYGLWASQVVVSTQRIECCRSTQ